MDLDSKYKALIDNLSSLKDEGAAVAFSGGVDSSFLCYAAHEALGDRAIAITVSSPMFAASEMEDANRVAKQVGIRHLIVREEEIDPEVASNPKNRCYFCKKIEFGTMLKAALKEGIHVVLDGTNMDDEGDYRPGLKALAELHIKSPMREAGLSKQDIRDLSRRFNIPTWDKPAFACLASRIPYGTRISNEKLHQIEESEDVLRTLGFKQFRVRHYGEIARIEVAPEERRKFFDEKLMDDVSRRIKAAGFLYVALELEGYKMGSLNRAIGAAK
jgi:uncharacterized protein